VQVPLHDARRLLLVFVPRVAVFGLNGSDPIRSTSTSSSTTTSKSNNPSRTTTGNVLAFWMSPFW
jgi:hypothetical protein